MVTLAVAFPLELKGDIVEAEVAGERGGGREGRKKEKGRALWLTWLGGVVVE